MKRYLKVILLVISILVISFIVYKLLEASLNNVSDISDHYSQSEKLDPLQGQNSTSLNLQEVEQPKEEQKVETKEVIVQPTNTEPLDGDNNPLGNAPEIEEEQHITPNEPTTEWIYNCLTAPTASEGGLVASHRNLAIGTKLKVYNINDTSKFVQVTVVSRNADSYTRCLSISPAAMEVIAPGQTLPIYTHVEILK